MHGYRPFTNIGVELSSLFESRNKDEAAEDDDKVTDEAV